MFDGQLNMIRPRKRAKCHPHQVLTWLMSILVLLGLYGYDAATSANAQKTRPQNIDTTAATMPEHSLVLRPGKQSYALARHGFILKQGANKASYQKVIQRYRNNQLSRTDSYPMVRLGFSAEPHWLIVPVENATVQKRWALDLGRLARGRSGLLSEAYIFEHNQQTEVLDALPRKESSGDLEKKLQGNIIPINLEPDQQHLLVLYLRAYPGMPGTFHMRLTPQQSADTTARAIAVDTGDVIIYGPLALFFVLLGVFAITGRVAALAGAFFYGIQGAYLLVFDHIVFTNITWLFYAMLLAMPAAMLAALIMIKDLYGFHRNQNKTGFWSVAGLFILTGAGALLGCAEIGQRTPVIGAWALYGPITAVLAGVLLLSFFHESTGKDKESFHSHIYAGSWILLGLGFFASALAHLAMLPPGVYANNAYFYALIIHGIITTGHFLYIFRHMMPDTPVAQKDRAASATINEPGGVVQAQKLRNSRHNSEHTRLLRVIEREREILHQLRAQEKKRVEEMRRAKDAANSANEAKSVFLAVVSHEIRTPMTGIMGMVRLLENTQLTKEQKEYVETIKDSGDAMMALMNDILDFEKIESGKLQLEMADFDIVRMCKDIDKLMSGHSEAKNTTLELKIDDNVPKYVVGDSSRLRQVLLNLINNAIKFTKDGTVTLQVSHLGQKESDSGTTIHQLYFAVRDTGIGISPEAQDKLFTPFSQADASITRKYGGTGLGLAICKRLIEIMNADISLKSQPGEGSTFFFTLEMPEGLAESAIEAGESSQISADQGWKPTSLEALHILIAEDNATNRKVIETFLSQQGHSCTSVENGKSALSTIEKERFDMLITDIEMQDMNGQELTHQLRNHDDALIANIPVIALTGNIRDEDIAAYHEAGMNDVLAKPVTPEALDDAIRRVQHGETLGTQTQSSTGQASTEQASRAQAEGSETTVSQTQKDYAESNIAFNEEGKGQAQSQERTQTEDTCAYYDAKVLDNLKANTSADGFQDMIGSVFTETDRLLAELDEAFSESEWERLLARAHELKGMSANFGLTQIAEIAGGIEKALRYEEDCDLAGELSALHEANTATRAAVQDKLGPDVSIETNTG